MPALFGYGQTVHTSIERLHHLYPDTTPSEDEAEQVTRDTFHLKHVPPSSDPVTRPGAYENARNRAIEIAREYVTDYGSDFEHQRQVEATFEIPAANCVIAGSIDLILHEDDQGQIIGAEIIDFKTMEGGDDPAANPELDWTELALQVQLYVRAAEQILGRNARTGSVHLLRDNTRVEVPITDEAIDAALANIEWAVRGILASDFPMRPHNEKCSNCDFAIICPRTPENFAAQTTEPPELHLPGDRTEMVPAFSRFQP